MPATSDPRAPSAAGTGSPPGTPRPWLKRAAVAIASAVLLLLALLGGVRLGVKTDAGRALALRTLNGLPLGPVGRLRVEGLQGDLLGDFRIARLAIVDARGPWLDAADLSMSWSPGELLVRRFHAERISAASVRILRGPVMAETPTRKAGRAPVSIAIDDLHLRLETLPVFSVRRGLWDVAGRLRMSRSGSADGRIQALSRLHAGDGLTAVFQLGEHNRVRLRADAVESSGGGLAGALGLPADRRLVVRGRADGTDQAGALDLTASSGDQTPLSAQATWTRGGATLQAHMLFAASRLTTFLAERAGPDARLALTARHASGDVYDLHGTVAARDASLAVEGPLDWRKRNSSGLKLRMQVADLSRWLGFLKAGPTTTQGVLAGDIDHLHYKGAVDARRLVQNGYSLAQVRGPLAYDRSPGEWRLRTESHEPVGKLGRAASRGLQYGIMRTPGDMEPVGRIEAEADRLMGVVGHQGTGKLDPVQHPAPAYHGHDHGARGFEERHEILAAAPQQAGMPKRHAIHAVSCPGRAKLDRADQFDLETVHWGQATAVCMLLS